MYGAWCTITWEKEVNNGQQLSPLATSVDSHIFETQCQFSCLNSIIGYLGIIRSPIEKPLERQVAEAA